MEISDTVPVTFPVTLPVTFPTTLPVKLPVTLPVTFPVSGAMTLANVGVAEVETFCPIEMVGVAPSPLGIETVIPVPAVMLLTYSPTVCKPNVTEFSIIEFKSRYVVPSFVNCHLLSASFHLICTLFSEPRSTSIPALSIGEPV